MAQARFVGLGQVAGTNGTEAYGLSADGSTVVGSFLSGVQRAPAKWTAADGWTALGPLPGQSGGVALSASADGSAIVGSANIATQVAAVRWSTNAVAEDLGVLPAGVVGLAGAYAISSEGDIVGRP
ncbi:MAG TPA: PEP-CTERM sorting domain-containing protein, partial [Phycisphaerae bacterium]|nr:PEP-CTERM sorting domain-containing protein [Phycisphaerae bacterium]